MLNLHWTAGHIIPKPFFVPLSELGHAAEMIAGEIADMITRKFTRWRAK